MLISTLFTLLNAHIKDRVRRGDFTERSLARRAGISQPHLHNVLKGQREMSPKTADALMRELGVTVHALVAMPAPPRDKSREPAAPSAPN